MQQTGARVLSLSGRGACAALWVALVTGCGGTLPKVDPYATLLPAGVVLVDRTVHFSAASLKSETAHLVVGANFVSYVELWTKLNKQAEQGPIPFSSRAVMLEMSAQWSPAKTTGMVVTSLQKHFKDVVVVDDFVDARAKGAKWIVMFDHAFVQPSWMTTTWTNTTTIDLLDGSIRRVAGASFSEVKRYDEGVGEAAALRITRNAGDDVLRSVNGALAQFEAKLAATR